jgi:hypothetical protein
MWALGLGEAGLKAVWVERWREGLETWVNNARDVYYVILSTILLWA